VGYSEMRHTDGSLEPEVQRGTRATSKLPLQNRSALLHRKDISKELWEPPKWSTSIPLQNKFGWE
jgi:hypothetical protein